MKVVNPANEEVIKELDIDTKETLAKKYDLLKDGLKSWKNREIDQRILCIQKFKGLLLQNIDEFAQDLHRETGKPLQEALNEINGACYRIQYFIDHTKETLIEKKMNTADGTDEVLKFDPLGVIGNISAWNYPYLVGVNVFIPALLAGNTVLYKPSEYASLSGLNIEKALNESGIPENVFQVAIGAGEVGKVLLDLPLDGYFFTGSYQTGRAIAEAVSHKLVPVGLELGGKDPVYVMDDIKDVSQTASALVEGAFYNNGQSCCSVERIYVHESLYDDFVAKFSDEVKNMTDPAPLTRPQHISFLEDQVKDAVEKGATLLVGGQRIQKQGAYFAPTVLSNVNHQMKLMKEESFGPIIGIQKVQNDEEALKLMNDTEYGLTSGVYGQDKERALKILNDVDSGTGYWNCCDRVSPYLPWSGRGNSGLGATLSYLGVLSFVKPKGLMLRG